MPTPVGPRPVAPVVTTPLRDSPAPASTPAPSASAVTTDTFETAVPPPPPTSLPASLNLGADQIRQLLDDVSVSVSARADTTLADTPHGSLTVSAGTRLSASVSDYSLSVSAEPPFSFDPKPGPKFHIKSLSYDFETARFHVDAEGVGPDFLYSAAATWAAQHYLKPLLPAALQRPGYDPRTDPALVSTLQSIAAGGAGTSATAGLANAFEKPSLYASFHTGDEIKLPISNGEAEVSIPAGTPFSVTADMTGPALHPEISDVHLQATGEHGITVAKTHGLAAGIAGLEIKEATLGRGGAVKLDYQLIPEQMIQGGYALLALFGAMAGDPSLLNQPMPDVKLDGIRKDVDDQIQAQVGPQVLELLKRNDGVIPGFSLTGALGVR